MRARIVCILLFDMEAKQYTRKYNMIRKAVAIARKGFMLYFQPVFPDGPHLSKCWQ